MLKFVLEGIMQVIDKLSISTFYTFYYYTLKKYKDLPSLPGMSNSINRIYTSKWFRGR